MIVDEKHNSMLRVSHWHQRLLPWTQCVYVSFIIMQLLITMSSVSVVMPFTIPGDEGVRDGCRSTTTQAAKPLLSKTKCTSRRQYQRRQPHSLLEQRSRRSSSSRFQQRSSATTSSTTLYDALLPDGGVSPCVIRVLGVGGGGSNAVDRMLEEPIQGIEYWAINTDAQALDRSAKLGAGTMNIGQTTTRGLGAGGDPAVGQLAAEESVSDLSDLLTGTDLCFIASGMGGGTGSGAAPIVAKMARQCGALSIAIVTKPFAFEGPKRMQQALDAIERLRESVDTLVIVSNDRLLEIIPEGTPLTSAFKVADDILRQGVEGISELIVRPGLINVDFADVQAVMKDAGNALIGIGFGEGPTAAEDATIAAISSPLLDEPVQEATGVVFNVVGGPTMSLQQVNRAAQVIYDNVDEDANVIFGALVDPNMTDEVHVTVLATGFKLND